MRVFVFLVLCIIAVNGGLSTLNLPKTDIYEMKFFKYSMECLIEKKIDLTKYGLEEDVKKAVEELHKDEKGCFAGCVYKKLGAVKDDGTVNEDKLFIGTSAEAMSQIRQIVDTVVKHCTDEVGRGDICKFSACIVTEAIKYMPK